MFRRVAVLQRLATLVQVQEIVKFVTQCKDGEKQTAVLQALVSHPSSVKFDQLVSKVNAMNIMENAVRRH